MAKKRDEDVHFYRTKEFMVIKKRWAAKLARSGFDDIEVCTEYVTAPLEFERNSLYQHHNCFSQAYSTEEFLTRREYFLRASTFLETYNFATKRDRYIWGLHCEGLSLREIRPLMKSLNYKANYLNAINHTVNRLRAIMVEELSKHRYVDEVDE